MVKSIDQVQKQCLENLLHDWLKDSCYDLYSDEAMQYYNVDPKFKPILKKFQEERTSLFRRFWRSIRNIDNHEKNDVIAYLEEVDFIVKNGGE